jgi:predicted Na+-dependent transporter
MLAGRGLEHHLVLVVVLQAVGVLAVAAVLGAAAGLHVGGLPGLGAEGAQEGGGVAGAGADFHVVGLQQRAALGVPVGLQREDDLLEGKTLSIDASDIWFSLLALLAAPMLAGLAFAWRLPALTEKIQKPLANFSLFALLAFIALGLVRERQLLTLGLLPMLGLVIAHNACGLAFGWITSTLMRLPERDRRAVMIEGGMQNSGLALGIIAVQFGSDLGMVIIASLWGIWHIVSGLGCAFWWRKQDARSAH